MKIYLAGALFSEADRDWLSGLKRRMEGIGEDVTLLGSRGKAGDLSDM